VPKSLALAALLLLPAAARAADGGFKTMSFGEGGGYKHPDPATQQYLDDAAQTAAGGVAAANPPAPSAPPLTPAAPSAPAAPAPTPAAAAAPAPAASPARGPRRSLWNGAVRPLDAGAAAAEPDAAREGAERDYETRVLGLRAPARRPALADASSAAAAESAPGRAALAPVPERRLFVSFEIDAREAGGLRDAVAGLGAAGFAPDARFDAFSAPGGVARVSGWLPAANLADALKRPGVKSASVEAGTRPTISAGAASDFLIGLRVTDPARPGDDVAAGVSALVDAAGFRMKRVVGVETAPDGEPVALVEGRLALSRLSSALAAPGVIQIAPLLPAAPEASAAAAPERGLKGFAKFSLERGLWLILLTLIVALPSMRSAAARVAAVFNPYR